MSFVMSWTSCVLLVSCFTCALSICTEFPNVPIDSRQLELTLLGNPKQFVPSSVYTVKLASHTPFTQFMLTCAASLGEGSFQILSSKKTAFANDCVNTIVEANEEEKRQIHVLWTSPPSGCVDIKGAVKTRGTWVAVKKTMCVLEGMSSATPSPATCCACDHAKYKIVFEGLWSPETHPKDFPTSLWLTHFSDVIGASHTPNFIMWGEGELASYGFTQLAEYGVVREMETELRNKSTQLRSIIKAAGLWHPNLNGKTTAIFHVDPRRHLLSVASMFGPSPDWVVGVAGFNLCHSNCSWLEKDVIDLYPYDAGTDNGVSYMSINSPTDPQEKIRKITTMYPEDPRAPFYDPSGHEMKPLAKLFITREKIFPKLCSDLTEAEILEQVSLTENTEEEVRPECGVTAYSVWTPCSVTCGKGIRMRSREYLNPAKSKMFKCDRQLVSKEMCVSDMPQCPGQAEEEEVAPLAASGECDVTPWSEWSDCSVTCGIGFILRTRTFTAADGQVHKKCMHISTMEKEKCMQPPCTLQEPEVSPACSVTEWSEWSPCSVTCGQGQRVRVRQFTSPNPPAFCATITPTKQTNPCSHKKSCHINLVEAKSICLLNQTTGPCRGSFVKWAYNSETNSCQTFEYGGCRGNRNRFDSLEECNSVCGNLAAQTEGGRVNCVVSNWSEWSPCYPCDNGTRTKTRTIMHHPKNNGRQCPPLVKTIKCKMPAEFCTGTDHNVV